MRIRLICAFLSTAFCVLLVVGRVTAGWGEAQTPDVKPVPQIVVTPFKEKNQFYGTKFTPNGRFLISHHIEGYETTARVWDMNTCSLRQTIWTWEEVNAITIAPDNKIFALGTFEWAQLRDVESGLKISSLDFKGDMLTREAMEFSPNGKSIAFAFSNRAQGETVVRLWSVSQKKFWKTLPVTKDMSDATCVAWSPDGKLIACGYGTEVKMDEWIGEIKIFRVFDGKLVAHLKGHTDHVWRIAFSPDAQKLASASSDKTVRFWDVATGRALRALQNNGAVQSVVFADDGNTLACGDDQTIRIWNSDGTEARSWHAHDAYINSVAFAPHRNLLISASDDGSIKLWDWKTGTLRVTLRILNTEYSKRGQPTTTWIMYTPEGYYSGSKECESSLQWRIGEKLLPAAKYKTQFRRPDKVRQALLASD